MPYVITKLCDGCKSTACVPVCPVECIYGLSSETNSGQLFINPDECIDCGACEPECPFDAIFDGNDIPQAFKEDVKRNTDFFLKHPKSELTTKPTPINEHPTSAQIAANKKKHA